MNGLIRRVADPTGSPTTPFLVLRLRKIHDEAPPELHNVCTFGQYAIDAALQSS
jgi:hypothetical protein